MSVGDIISCIQKQAHLQNHPKPDVSSFCPWCLQTQPCCLFVGVLVGVGEGH